MDRIARLHRRHHNPAITIEDCWHCGKRRAQCASKSSFDEWDAINQAHVINVREDWAKPVRAYWCHICGHHHLTRANTPRKRRRIERQGRRRMAREEDPLIIMALVESEWQQTWSA